MKQQIIAACTVIALIGCSTAFADTIDQSQLSGNIAFALPVYQSFTAGLSGELTQLMLASNLGGGGSGTVNLEFFAGGPPGSGLPSSSLGDLPSVSYSYTAADLDTYLDVSPLDINVTAGSLYTFEVISETGPMSQIQANDQNPYSGGELWNPPYFNPSYTFVPGGNIYYNFDLVFQTYVEPPATSVPDACPTFALLGVAGLALIGLQRRRRLA